MHDYTGMFLDGGLSDHWPDLVLVALIPLIGWLLNRSVAAVDDRQKAADAEAKKQGDRIVEHTVKLETHELRISNLENGPRKTRVDS